MNQLRPYLPSASLRRIARATHIAAVARLGADDRDGFYRGLRRVQQLDDLAREAEHFEAECRLTRRALVAILERAESDKGSGRAQIGRGE